MNFNHKPGSTFRSLLLIILFLIAGLALTSGNAVLHAENGGDPNKIVQDSPDLDILVINNKNYKKDRKEPSRFEHKKHAMEYKITCFECHHEYRAADKEAPAEPDKEKENLYNPWKETKKCAECHDPLVKKDNAPKLQAAYHLNCKGCHEEKKIYKDKSPLEYRKCTTCHQKDAPAEKPAE